MVLLIIVLAIVAWFAIKNYRKRKRMEEVKKAAEVILNNDNCEKEARPVIDTILVNLVDITINKIGKVHSDGILVHIKDGYQRIVFENVKYNEFFQSLLGEKDLVGLSYDYILTNHYSMTDNEAWLLRHQNGSLEIADWVIMGKKLVNQDTMKRIVNVVETHNEKVAISKYACSPWEVYVRCDNLK